MEGGREGGEDGVRECCLHRKVGGREGGREEDLPWPPARTQASLRKPSNVYILIQDKQFSGRWAEALPSSLPPPPPPLPPLPPRPPPFLN